MYATEAPLEQNIKEIFNGSTREFCEKVKLYVELKILLGSGF